MRRAAHATAVRRLSAEAVAARLLAPRAKPATQTLVSDLRKHYPMARLYLSVSPMLSGDNRTKQKGYLATVQSTRATAGDHNVAILEFMPRASDAWTCGHPNAATQVIMATAFEQVLSTDLGW